MGCGALSGERLFFNNKISYNLLAHFLNAFWNQLEIAKNVLFDICCKDQVLFSVGSFSSLKLHCQK